MVGKIIADIIVMVYFKLGTSILLKLQLKCSHFFLVEVKVDITALVISQNGQNACILLSYQSGSHSKFQKNIMMLIFCKLL